ncbi:MAG: hypothetical protein CVU05_14970 [Bacteroidetes bacterium HGW-Bacteroidetes-21]|jgi:protein TonB|nr:MAG: hypothetical protein CVU05_14970 [Bacteroidetes bacterium HGW-Bacteroidetes-21]
METKKSPKANLENYRGYFLKTGIIISLAAVLLAFEWKEGYNDDFDRSSFTSLTIEPDMIPRTFPKEQPKIVPPIKVKVLDKITIIDDNQKGDDLTGLLPSDDPYPTIIDIAPIVDKPDPDPLDPWKLEVQPQFIGGDEALISFLEKNLDYPDEAVRENISGKVFIKFIIDEKGKVTDINVERGVHYDLDNEALRVVSLMPDWKPGFAGGKYVKSYFILPINFKFSN